MVYPPFSIKFRSFEIQQPLGLAADSSFRAAESSEETLADPLEGLTDGEMLAELIHSALDDEALVSGLSNWKLLDRYFGEHVDRPLKASGSR